jgi:biopolymer transport protein ExbD
MINQGFDKDEYQAPLAEINMTPFVDIMLVLLVIFLITAPIIHSSIDLNLPNEQGRNLEHQNQINISITKDGQYYLEQKKIEINDLKQHLIEIAKEDVQTPINLQADENVAYGQVSKILALIQQSGLNNIGFIFEN